MRRILLRHPIEVDQARRCWLWLGAKNKKGYGWLNGGLAHRFMYVLFKGPIPAGLELDHVCSVRHCVAPYHLEAVTRGENMRRTWARRPATATPPVVP